MSQFPQVKAPEMDPRARLVARDAQLAHVSEAIESKLGDITTLNGKTVEAGKLLGEWHITRDLQVTPNGERLDGEVFVFRVTVPPNEWLTTNTTEAFQQFFRSLGFDQYYDRAERPADFERFEGDWFAHSFSGAYDPDAAQSISGFFEVSVSKDRLLEKLGIAGTYDRVYQEALVNPRKSE